MMNPCRILAVFLMLSVSTLVYGQQDYDSPTSFDLKYQLTKGSQFQIKYHTQQDAYLTVNGVESRTTNGQDATLLLTVLSANDIEATLEATYQQIGLQSSSADQHISVNTTSDDTGEYNRLFKAMTGKKFTMVMQKYGSLKNITGLDSIFDQMIAAVPEVKPADRATLKKFLESQFGGEALKASLAYVLPNYPARSVQLNGSWMSQLYTGGFYNGRIDNYWKLEYGDKYTIKLSNQGKFNTDSTQEVDMGGGQQGFVDLKGEIRGNYVIDPETDWPSICITHTELNGNYIYESPKKKSRHVLVPVRVVMDASYQFKHL